MRTFALAIVMLALLTGCSDRSAREHAEKQKALNEALELFRQAESGYVPEQTGMKSADLAGYRQKKLKDAADTLRQVTDTSSGPAWVRLQANQLLAEADASAARATARDAMGNWASLANRSATLLSLLGIAEQAASRMTLFDVDQTPLVNRLLDDQNNTQRTLGELRRAAAQLNEKIDELTTSITQLTDKRDQTLANAQRVREQAFGAEGQQKYDLEDEAASIVRTANSLDAQAQHLGVKHNVFNSELNRVEHQIQLAEEVLAAIGRQIDDANNHQLASQQQIEAARADRDAAVDQLETEFHSIAQDYRQKVEQPLGQAAQTMTDAVSALEQAQKLAKSADRQAVQLELVSAQVGQVYILTNHIIACGDFGHTTAAIAAGADRLAPDRRNFAEQYHKLRQVQARLIQEALATIEAAKSVAQALADGGHSNEVREIANEQLAHLDNYARRIGTAQLEETWSQQARVPRSGPLDEPSDVEQIEGSEEMKETEVTEETEFDFEMDETK
ncbi:MAG: hypothetical protein V3U29_05645 [Phycisphaeraceae bacterium]